MFDYRHHARVDPDYDGIAMLMRHGTLDEISPFAKNYPSLAAQFPLMFYRIIIGALFDDDSFYRKQAQELAATNGHDDSPGSTRIPANCAFPQYMVDNIHLDSVGKLAEHYGTHQTKTLLFAAPIPDCANAPAILARWREMNGIAPPKLMPTSSFVDDKYYIHVTPKAVPESTGNLVDAIRIFLAEAKQ